MIIAHLNSELIHFSLKRNASMFVFINISVKEYNHTFHISIELLLMFLKPNILTAMFSGATERRRKPEMLKI